MVSSLAFRAVFARESTLIIGERFACIMEHNSMPRRVTDASLARNSINNHHTTERIDNYLFSHRISGRAWRQDPPDRCEHETVSIISVNRQTRQSVGGDVLGNIYSRQGLEWLYESLHSDGVFPISIVWDSFEYNKTIVGKAWSEPLQPLFLKWPRKVEGFLGFSVCLIKDLLADETSFFDLIRTFDWSPIYHEGFNGKRLRRDNVNFELAPVHIDWWAVTRVKASWLWPEHRRAFIKITTSHPISETLHNELCSIKFAYRKINFR